MNFRAKQGVLVGCDQKQEWMLPWWWSHFKAHNNLPVAFVDFGMTPHAQKWCKSKGLLIPLKAPLNFAAPKAQISPELIDCWERKYGLHLWSGRAQWFYKPFAMLQTPFKETLWLDLDCEVLSSLTHLYKKLHPHSRLALAKDTRPSFEPCYNSGVIVYDAKSPLLSRWAASCIQNSHQFLSDQDVLTHLIEKSSLEIAELPSKYNWTLQSGIHPTAAILHWSGAWGKQVIRNKL
jgi:hypothetical protein